MEILTKNKKSVEIVLKEEKSKDFLHYIKKIDITKSYKDMLILSANHHFFYEYDEIKNVKIILNIKKLNYIYDINNFMSALLTSLSTNTYFYGCFIDNKFSFNFKKDNNLNRFLNAFSILANYPRLTRLLSTKNVYNIFEAHGFEIFDMQEINGVMYFSAKKL